MNVCQKERCNHVSAMRANFAIEGMYADAEDIALQERYIAGTASLDDLLNHARAFSAKNAPSGACTNLARTVERDL